MAGGSYFPIPPPRPAGPSTALTPDWDPLCPPPLRTTSQGQVGGCSQSSEPGAHPGCTLNNSILIVLIYFAGHCVGTQLTLELYKPGALISQAWNPRGSVWDLKSAETDSDQFWQMQ